MLVVLISYTTGICSSSTSVLEPEWSGTDERCNRVDMTSLASWSSVVRFAVASLFLVFNFGGEILTHFYTYLIIRNHKHIQLSSSHLGLGLTNCHFLCCLTSTILYALFISLLSRSCYTPSPSHPP
jgi:hypothetical protein